MEGGGGSGKGRVPSLTRHERCRSRGQFTGCGFCHGEGGGEWLRVGWGGGVLLISMNDGVSKVSLLGTVFVVVGVSGEG